LRTALTVFSPEDLIDFFDKKGLGMNVERQGRVFPQTDKASSVLTVLEKCLKSNGVEVLYGQRVASVERADKGFVLTATDRRLEAHRVVIATGGASYRATGSSGDGYSIASALGHEIADLSPGLVPLRVSQKWIAGLQGLGLENIKLTFLADGNKIVSDIGELMFTHFGVSGPLVLDLSEKVVKLVSEKGQVDLFIDLKPGLREEQIDSKLLHKFKTKGESTMKSVLKDMMPLRLVDVFLKAADIDGGLKTNQVKQDQRRRIVKCLKAFPLTVVGALDIEEAMITSGGVSTKQIDPRTMESRLVKGLYFAGEIMDMSAASGGYNLQEAFSTGYLAGEMAARGLAAS
jgi:predicted Rossmann fold flavoprotein